MQGEDNYKEIDLKVYQRLIDKLMYLLCGISLDIFFVVGPPSKRNMGSKMEYLKVVKQVV